MLTSFASSGELQRGDCGMFNGGEDEAHHRGCAGHVGSRSGIRRNLRDTRQCPAGHSRSCSQLHRKHPVVDGSGALQADVSEPQLHALSALLPLVQSLTRYSLRRVRDCGQTSEWLGNPGTFPGLFFLGLWLAASPCARSCGGVRFSAHPAPRSARGATRGGRRPSAFSLTARRSAVRPRGSCV